MGLLCCGTPSSIPHVADAHREQCPVLCALWCCCCCSMRVAVGFLWQLVYILVLSIVVGLLHDALAVRGGRAGHCWPLPAALPPSPACMRACMRARLGQQTHVQRRIHPASQREWIKLMGGWEGDNPSTTYCCRPG